MAYSSVNLIQSFIIFFTVISCAITVDLPYKDCANREIQSMRIEPCESHPCRFRIGDRVNVTVEFIANHNTSEVKLYGLLRTGGLFNYEMSYQGVDQNACNSGKETNKLACPLVEGKLYKFTISQVVPYASRFNIFRFATWKMVGLNDRKLMCAEFSISRNKTIYRFFVPFIEKS